MIIPILNIVFTDLLELRLRLRAGQLLQAHLILLHVCVSEFRSFERLGSHKTQVAAVHKQLGLGSG